MTNHPVNTSADPEHTPSIAAAVVVDNGRVLLVRRRVSEGQLSWQFPAGEVEPGESPTEAAVREAQEEVALTVSPVETLGQRQHPATGRTMVYIACSVLDGAARVADEEELAEVAWCSQARLKELVPYPFYGPVQDYFDATLAD